MKKYFFVFVALVLSASSVMSQGSSSIEPIMESGLQFIKDVEKNYGDQTIVLKAEFDFAFDDNMSYMNLSNKVDYVIAGLGDANVADISLIVYKKDVKGDWVEMERDSEYKNSATVTVSPKEEGQYAIDIKVNKFATESRIGHVGFFVVAVPR